MSENQAFATTSGGNVFEDLEIPDAAVALAKAELVRNLMAVLRERGLTQEAAAELLGTSQPRLSHVLSGRTENVTLDSLVRYLDALGYVVTVGVEAKRPVEQRAYEVAGASAPAIGG